jgi:CheY-like chemotaxis protein
MAIRSLETSLLPDLILMDAGLAGSPDGIMTAELIRSRFPVPLFL